MDGTKSGVTTLSLGVSESEADDRYLYVIVNVWLKERNDLDRSL